MKKKVNVSNLLLLSELRCGELAINHLIIKWLEKSFLDRLIQIEQIATLVTIIGNFWVKARGLKTKTGINER